jgi:hypothetical protein
MRNNLALKLLKLGVQPPFCMILVAIVGGDYFNKYAQIPINVKALIVMFDLTPLSTRKGR